jgi:hypothetical protein
MSFGLLLKEEPMLPTLIAKRTLWTGKRKKVPIRIDDNVF